jgi:hypothetical protein
MQLMRDLGPARAGAHIDLLERIGASADEIASLAFAFPREAGVARLVGLFTDHPHAALWNSGGVWRQLDPAVRSVVIARFIDGELVPHFFSDLQMLLAELSAAQRAEHEERLWETFIARQRTLTMWPPYPVVFSDLRTAPEPVRLCEARRQVDAVAADPKLAHYLLDYASLLPPVEAFERLRPYVRHEDPMQRTPACLAWLRVVFDPVAGPGALPPRERLEAALDFFLPYVRAGGGLDSAVLRHLLQPFQWYLPKIGGRAADVPRLEELVAIGRSALGDDDYVLRGVSEQLERLRGP